MGGAVSGLNGTVVLQNNGADDLSVSANGAFRFATEIASGNAYRVTVKTQPAVQNCTVTNDSGAVGSAAITNVQVTCTAASFTISGPVTGLQGSGLVLQNNGRDDVTVSASDAATFQFATVLAGGEAYRVTVLKQPVNPVQKCTVENGAGTASNASVPAPIVHCETLFSRFAYSTNNDLNSISIYSVDSANGQLRQRGSAITEDIPLTLAVDSQNQWLVTTDSSAKTIATYAISRTDGSLRSVGAAIPTDDQPTAVAFHPNGQFVYVVTTGKELLTFSIDSEGNLTEVDPAHRAPTETGPVWIAIDPSGGRFAYVVNGDSASVSIYSIDPASGVPTAVGKIDTGLVPRSMTIDPSIRFVYVSNDTSRNLSIFRITDSTTGALEKVPDSPITLGTFPSNLALDPSGRFAFVAADGQVRSYGIATDGSGLLGASTSSIDVGAGTHTVTTDGQGKFVFVTGLDANRLETFSVNQDTGVLERVDQVATSGPPARLAISTGNTPVRVASTFAYVVSRNATAGSVALFPFDPVRGLKSKIEPETPLAAEPSEIALDPRGRYAYITGAPNVVSGFTIDGSSGGLTALPLVTAGAAPSGIAVDATGRFAFVANTNSHSVSRFLISNSTAPGELLAGADVSTAGFPITVAVEPTGRAAYVGYDALKIVPYKIDPLDGTLTAKTTVIATDLIALAVHPSGRFLFEVAQRFDQNVSAFAIGPATNELTRLPGNFTAGADPVALAVAPSGRFLYTLNQDATRPGVFRFGIDPATGVLEANPREFLLTPGTVPTRIAFDATGSFLYIVEGDAGVEVFALDRTTGDLSNEKLGQFTTGGTAVSIAMSSVIQ